MGYAPGSLPITEQLAAEVLSLPIFPEITAAQQEQVIQALGGVSRVIPLGSTEEAAQAA